MKSIGIITFHAAHNYGSLLQNYALQQVLLKLGFNSETINLRTPQQKEQYSPFTPFFKLIDKKRIILTIAYLPFKRTLLKKKDLFEEFLNSNLILSNEVASNGEIQKLPMYDAYISGSDQIWNISARDFQWSYFLDFVKSGIPKIAYAASMGTYPESVFQLEHLIQDKIKQLVSQYTWISVREEKTAKVIDQILGEKKCSVLVDPTLLLSAEEWNLHISNAPLVKGEYIFLYNPYYLPDVYKQAKELSKITGLKVVVSNINIKSLLHSPEFVRKLDVGPWEFLNLIKNARYVIGRSFHLLVFSILFKKSFIAVNGMGDSRLNNLLVLTRLQKCVTGEYRLEEVLTFLKDINYEDAFKALENERIRSFNFLQTALR